MLKLKIDDCEIKDGTVVLKKMTIFDDSSSRDVEVNEKLLSLFKSLEVDISKYMQISRLMETDVKLLVDLFDLQMFNET